MKNYYQILGIFRTASQDEIKKAYKLLVHAWHPDKFPEGYLRINAEQKLSEINEAYSSLKNLSSRKIYDKEYREFYQSSNDSIPDGTEGIQPQDESDNSNTTEKNLKTPKQDPNSGSNSQPNYMQLFFVILLLGGFLIAFNNPNIFPDDKESAGGFTPLAPIVKATITSTSTARPGSLSSLLMTRSANPTFNLPYTEDFSSTTNSIWAEWNSKNLYARYFDGHYEIFSLVGGEPNFVWGKTGNLHNIILEFTSTFSYGYPDPLSGFSVSFRCQEGNINNLCYYLFVSEQGAVAITKISSSDQSFPGELIFSHPTNISINTFNHPNNWIISMDKENFNVYCNDKLIAKFTDSDLPSGKIGFGSISGKNFDDDRYYDPIWIDNIRITEIK